MSEKTITGVQILSKVNTAALWAAGVGLILMTCFVAWQVWCRYVLNDSPSWTEPGAVMLMSWFIFLGAAVGVRENTHLGFDVLLYVLPSGGKRVLRMISDIVIGGVLIPGLLAVACLALVLTVAILRLLSATGASRRLALPPVVELAVLVIVFGLLVQSLPATGLLQ